jgi:hypothetical protein
MGMHKNSIEELVELKLFGLKFIVVKLSLTIVFVILMVLISEKIYEQTERLEA